jgi:hypothetical protein
VVLDECEHAVLAVVEGLEAVDQVAIGFEDVDAVLGRMAEGHAAHHESVGTVHPDAYVLDRVDRAVVAGLDPAGVDHHVIGAHA